MVQASRHEGRNRGRCGGAAVTRHLSRAMSMLGDTAHAPLRLGHRRFASWCRECRGRFVAGTQHTEFCSQSCRDAARRRRSRHHSDAATSVLVRRCEACLSRYVSAVPRQRFCSATCRKRAWHDASRAVSPRRTTCAHAACRGDLSRPRAGQQYCSTRCRVAAHRAARQGAAS